MAKRSHHIASRQAAISRERKKKKKSQATEKHSESSGIPAPIDVAVNSSRASNIAQTPVHTVSTRSSQSIQLDENRYQYVKRDLRKTIIIAVPLLIILIILAFVL